MPEADAQFKVVLEEEQLLKRVLIGNNPIGQEQQQSLVDSDVGGSLLVLADMIQVSHGTLVEGGSPATLIVLRFEFQPSGNYRRFKSVEARMTFSEGTSSTTSPEVIEIAPRGAWSILPSKIPEESSHTISPSIGGGGPITAKATYTWRLKKTVDKENSARIIGTIRAQGKDRSKKNTAIWTLLENPDTKSGIPTLLQTAVLLEREMTDEHPEGEKFTAALQIYGVVDKVTSLKDLRDRIFRRVKGKAEKGEDVIFNPKVNRGVVKDANNLWNDNLEEVGRVITLQKWKDGEMEPGISKAPEKADEEDSENGASEEGAEGAVEDDEMGDD